MKYQAVLGLLISVLVLAKAETDRLVRNTKYGKVRGTLLRSLDNPATEFYAFKGVPYARPPIGKYRFQEPRNPLPWHGIKNEVEPAQICVQIENHFNGNAATGSEDCLYVEVFEPKTARVRENQHGPLPVMVWLHGGTFIFGEADTTGADYLMEKPVVVVTVQYRLNVFGFLSTKDGHAMGNNGLKDQLQALKWVRDNIRNFGGDPNKVTIFGESAGGASVLYHILSPKSRGYFHRAISQSGSSLNRWAFQPNPREMAFKVGKHFGVKTQNTKTLIERLQKVDYRDLQLAAFNKSVVGFYTPYYAQPFGPSLEARSSKAFLSKRMFESLKNGDYTKVPYLSGYNSEEGSFAYIYINNGRTNISIYEEYPEILIPASMNIKKNSTCAQDTLNEIKEFYFKNTTVTDPKPWVDLMSQEIFVRGIIKTMEFMHQTLPMYFYYFNYTGGTPNSFFGGVGHYQEMQFLWYPKEEGSVPVQNEADRLTSKRLVTLWTNFANTSNPTPKQDELLQNVIWPKVDSTKPYLVFDKDLSVAHNPNKRDSEFWDRLYTNCGNPPYTIY